MNAPLATLDNIDSYKEMLPEGFVEATVKRQQLLNANRVINQIAVDEIDKNCSELATEFNTLGTNFTKKVESYTRLETASRKNSENHENLGSTLKELSRELRASAQTIRATYSPA